MESVLAEFGFALGALAIIGVLWMVPQVARNGEKLRCLEHEIRDLKRDGFALRQKVELPELEHRTAKMTQAVEDSRLACECGDTMTFREPLGGTQSNKAGNGMR